jgi:REP element-mobilizing transposase RayT
MPQVYDCIQAECTGLRVDLVAIGGIEDHVHVLVRIPPSIAISYLVQQLKGVSSHLANHSAAAEYVFKWQGGYGAFTVSKRSVADVRDYILNQEERHQTGRLYRALEPGSRGGHSPASA